MVKNLPANVGDIKDMGLIPGLGRFSGGGHGNPLQYSWLENPLDGGAGQATVHGVAKSQTRQKRLSTHACTWWLLTAMPGFPPDRELGED